MTRARILYCHCRYADVVPSDVKEAVLDRLAESGRDFEAVADLCELSARKDPMLARLAAEGPLRIAACFPRAVQWLFHAAGASLPQGTRVFNMREEGAASVAAGVLEEDSE